MNTFLVSVSCLIIFINTVPRVNDVQVHFGELSVRKWIRFVGLLVTAGSSLWLSIAALLPGYPHESTAALLMLGIAATWSTSPVVGSWWEFTFRHGGEDRYKKMNRRASDRERHV